MRHEPIVLAGAPAPPDGRCRLTYTVPEAAALLGISDDSYYRALKTGDVPGRKIRGRYVISRAQLHRYIDGGGVAP